MKEYLHKRKRSSLDLLDFQQQEEIELIDGAQSNKTQKTENIVKSEEDQNNTAKNLLTSSSQIQQQQKFSDVYRGSEEVQIDNDIFDLESRSVSKKQNKVQSGQKEEANIQISQQRQSGNQTAATSDNIIIEENQEEQKINNENNNNNQQRSSLFQTQNQERINIQQTQQNISVTEKEKFPGLNSNILQTQTQTQNQTQKPEIFNIKSEENTINQVNINLSANLSSSNIQIQQKEKEKEKDEIIQESKKEQENPKVQEQKRINGINGESEENILNCIVHFSPDCLYQDILNDKAVIKACQSNVHENQYLCSESSEKLRNSKCPICKDQTVKISANEKSLLKQYRMHCQYCKEKITKENFSHHLLEKYKYLSAKPYQKIKDHKRTMLFINVLSELEFFYQKEMETETKTEKIIEILKDIKTKPSGKTIHTIIYGQDLKYLDTQTPEESDIFQLSFPKIDGFTCYIIIKNEETKSLASETSAPMFNRSDFMFPLSRERNFDTFPMPPFRYPSYLHNEPDLEEIGRSSRAALRRIRAQQMQNIRERERERENQPAAERPVQTGEDSGIISPVNQERGTESNEISSSQNRRARVQSINLGFRRPESLFPFQNIGGLLEAPERPLESAFDNYRISPNNSIYDRDDDMMFTTQYARRNVGRAPRNNRNTNNNTTTINNTTNNTGRNSNSNGNTNTNTNQSSDINTNSSNNNNERVQIQNREINLQNSINNINRSSSNLRGEGGSRSEVASSNNNNSNRGNSSSNNNRSNNNEGNN